MNPRLLELAQLVGFKRGADVVVVTVRGVALPISHAHRDWTVAEFSRLLAEIEALPEIASC